MTGFSCGPSVIPPEVVRDEGSISNDGFFPNVALADLRMRVKLRDSVTVERLTDAVCDAVLWANAQLATWRASQQAETLADVDAPQINGTSRLLYLYQRAIDAETKAQLVERYRDMDLTGAGDRRVNELDASIGELRRDAIHAIRDFLGVPRTRVESL